jgi:hypothetical protein
VIASRNIFFEDLFTIGRSGKFCDLANSGQIVMNSRNLATGVAARRGDGTLGDRVGAEAVADPHFAIARGHIANVHIGVEVKILAKSMIKQIDSGAKRSESSS